MPKIASLLVLALSAASASAQSSPDGKDVAQALQDAGKPQARCMSKDPKEILVCGRSGDRYRIDPVVLRATRQAEAPPPKPPVTGNVPEAGCVGPNCGGGTTPLVGMALTALKAAELAAEGEDWRDAFRTHPDAYQTYQDAKTRQSKKGGISIGINAGNN